MFFDLEILEIHQKTLSQDNTIPDTSSGANQNNISEMNCQLLKMNTPQYQETQQKHYHKNNRQI